MAQNGRESWPRHSVLCCPRRERVPQIVHDEWNRVALFFEGVEYIVVAVLQARKRNVVLAQLAHFACRERERTPSALPLRNFLRVYLQPLRNAFAEFLQLNVRLFAVLYTPL